MRRLSIRASFTWHVSIASPTASTMAIGSMPCHHRCEGSKFMATVAPTSSRRRVKVGEL